MGNKHSKAANETSVDKFNARDILRNPVVQAMEKKHREEVEIIQKAAEKRAEADENVRSRQEKQHQRDLVALQSQLDHEANARRTAEELRIEADVKRAEAEEEAKEYSRRAEKAQKDRDDAIHAAEKARKAMEEAEERALSKRLAWDEQETDFISFK